MKKVIVRSKDMEDCIYEDQLPPKALIIAYGADDAPVGLVVQALTAKHWGVRMTRDFAHYEAGTRAQLMHNLSTEEGYSFKCFME